MSLFDLLLGLDAAVEDRTVTTLAENLLVERSLTSLTLHPEVAIFLLEQLQFLFSLDIDFFHFTFALLTDNVLVRFEEVLAAETCFLDLSELEQSLIGVAHGWLVDVSHVIASKEDVLSAVSQDRLKDPHQWLLQLIVDVVLIIDR